MLRGDFHDIQKILKSKKVLSVDDEPDVRAVIREELETCDLTTAGNFETAKQYLEQEKVTW